MQAADILIIGAGATGAAAAWSLSETGLRIVCLEQGGHMNPATYPSTTQQWEQGKAGAFHFSPNVRKLAADYPVNDAESPIAIANFNAVGGSTILFSGHFPRFHPSDFRVKSLDGVASDWPIDYQTLEPYFAKNDEMMGVSGLVGDPAYPPMTGLLPPLPLGRMGEVMGQGFNQLGWHWWPAYSAIISRAYRGRSPCINLGPCNTGCAQGAKSSVDVSYWPQALRNGVELRTGARVSRIGTDDQGLANGAWYFDADGNTQFQPARCVVLACNGVGTPRLLLNSHSERFPEGLANRSGLVGKNLMLHPLGYVEGVFEERLDAHLGPQGCSIYSHAFYETDASRGFVRGYTMQLLRGPGPVETAVTGMGRHEIPLGPQHHGAFAARFGKTVGMGIIVEDLPDENNRVTLDASLTDAHGIPAPKIHYALSDNSKKMLSHGLKQGRLAMRAAGAKKTSGFGPVRAAGWHLMGTAKMGLDPQQSVVDARGRSHDVPNLFVVDSSIFVTSGGVNPTSTMQALALYIAAGMKQNMASILGAWAGTQHMTPP